MSRHEQETPRAQAERLIEIAEWNARIDAERKAKHIAKYGPTSHPAPKVGAAHPFKHAKKMYMELLELRQKHAHNLPELQLLINSFPPYVSRGHGHHGHIKNRTINGVWRRVGRSKYQTPHQNVSECAKRSFHGLPMSQRAFIRHIEGRVA